MGFAKEEKLEQLEKVLQSRALHNSESLKAFLRFVVLKTLEEGNNHLKEYTIASEVFGQNNYDPRIDSVVRVQASRLRSKLQEYYATEGKRDQVIIDLPKGHYAPTFSSAAEINTSPLSTFTGNSRTAAAGVAPALQPSAADPDLDISVTPPLTSPLASNAPAPVTIESRIAPISNRLKFLLAGLVLLVVMLGMTTLYYRSQAVAVQSAALAEMGRNTELAVFWKEFLRSSQPTLIAYSNTLFERRADLTLKSFGFITPLEESKQGESPPPPASQIPSRISFDSQSDIVDYYTGVGEVMGVSALTNFFARADHPFRVKRSLLLNWDDVKTENIIILGSPAENLFLRRLPQAQDFTFRFNNELRVIELVNLRPHAGEAEIWRPRIERVKGEGPTTISINEDYALVSLIKGTSEQNRLLILAGITTHGTHAAAEYVTRPEYVKDLVAHLNTAADPAHPTLPDSFQVVLKVKVNGGVPVQISYVTHHVLQ